MQITETNPFGLPMLNNFYTVCSDVYGHRIQVPDTHYDSAFIEAVTEAYADGRLHDHGHLVVDKATDQLAFLVVERLDDNALYPVDRLVALSQRYKGVALSFLVMPANGEDPAYRLIAAQLDEVAQFNLVHALAADLVAISDGATQAPFDETLMTLLRYAKQAAPVDFSWTGLKQVLAPLYHDAMTLVDVVAIVSEAFEAACAEPRFQVSPLETQLSRILLSPVQGWLAVEPMQPATPRTRYSVEDFYNALLRHMMGALRMARKDWCAEWLR